MGFPEDFFLNFHAHQQMPAENEIVIQSLFLQNDLITNKSDKIFFTAGLHPWHADQLSKEQIEDQLEKLISSNTIIAIGETGIDKIKGPDIDLQIEVFMQHVAIAEKYRLPVIVHSVKAHNEILEIRKEVKSKIPWAIHHFNGSKQMSMNFIENGLYLSVSHHIKSKTSKLSEYFAELPLERIFLETDDFKIDLKELYRITSERFGISIENLKKQLIKNLKCFLNE